MPQSEIPITEKQRQMKKSVPPMVCLSFLLLRATPEDIRHSDIEDALLTRGNIDMNERLARSIYSHYMTDYVLSETADKYPELVQALVPREGLQLNDFEMAYFSTPSNPKNFGDALFRSKFAVDIILNNHHVPLERRREILQTYEQIALAPNTDRKE